MLKSCRKLHHILRLSGLEWFSAYWNC